MKLSRQIHEELNMNLAENYDFYNDQIKDTQEKAQRLEKEIKHLKGKITDPNVAKVHAEYEKVKIEYHSLNVKKLSGELRDATHDKAEKTVLQKLQAGINNHKKAIESLKTSLNVHQHNAANRE